MDECIWSPTPKQTEFLAASEDEVLYGGAAGGGKGQPLDALVATPFGYRKIGSLEVGCVVCGPDSSVSRVIAIYELGDRQLYKVSFADGTSTEVTDDHIWLAWKARGSVKACGDRISGESGARLYTTSELMRRMDVGVNFRIPLCEPLRFTTSAKTPWRPMDAYALGALLGDGALSESGLRLTSCDPDIAERVAEGIGRYTGPYVYGNRAPEYVFRCDKTRDYLSKVGLIGRDSFSKFIPAAYLLAPIEERWALLRGLMDTDGWAEADGDTYYCSVSLRLRDDVAALARSLGAYVTVREKRAKDQHGNGSLAYTLRIKLSDGSQAFSLERKKRLCDRRPQSMGRPIVSIEPTRIAEARCIKVSHPSGLYVTNDCILTHNTDALIIDALGLWQQAPLVARYRALIIRKSFAQLREVIDRTKTIYPAVVPGAAYFETAREWRFPSGAKVMFGYLERDSDCEQFQGQEFQFCGFEELTNWGSLYPWDFMRTRLRGTSLRKLMRATCNPGGIGSKVVQDRWRIPDDGGPSAYTETYDVDGEQVVRRLRFIPARVTDNPYLPAAYQANLMAQPDVVRRALLEGRWDVLNVPGAIYKTELDEARTAGRLTKVPYDPSVPVHTAWDLGIGDATAIWLAQVIGREIHLIDYYEGSGHALPHYCEWLSSLPYRYAEDILPHDAKARELGTGRTREEVLRANGRKTRILPAQSVEDGINAVRLMMGRSWFDADRCKRGLECLTHYRRDYNDRLGEFKALPIHDWSSHGADAMRALAMGLREQVRPAIKPYKPTVHVPMKQSGAWMG